MDTNPCPSCIVSSFTIHNLHVLEVTIGYVIWNRSFKTSYRNTSTVTNVDVIPKNTFLIGPKNSWLDIVFPSRLTPLVRVPCIVIWLSFQEVILLILAVQWQEATIDTFVVIFSTNFHRVTSHTIVLCRHHVIRWRSRLRKSCHILSRWTCSCINIWCINDGCRHIDLTRDLNPVTNVGLVHGLTRVRHEGPDNLCNLTVGCIYRFCLQINRSYNTVFSIRIFTRC